MREQLARPFADADAPDVEEVRAGDAVLLAEPSRVPLVGNVDPHPDDLVRDPLVSEAAPHHAPLLEELEVPRPGTFAGEPPNCHAVDLVEAGREVALPREVIGRVRGRDLDREMRPQALHHGARVRLGAARYVAVALHDDEEARV